MIKTPFRKKLHVVKSGIILDQLNNLSAQSGTSGTTNEDISSGSSTTSFLTSRFARVLLAGSGFLADAVSIISLKYNYSNCYY